MIDLEVIVLLNNSCFLTHYVQSNLEVFCKGSQYLLGFPKWSLRTLLLLLFFFSLDISSNRDLRNRKAESHETLYTYSFPHKVMSTRIHDMLPVASETDPKKIKYSIRMELGFKNKNDMARTSCKVYVLECFKSRFALERDVPVKIFKCSNFSEICFWWEMICGIQIFSFRNWLGLQTRPVLRAHNVPSDHYTFLFKCILYEYLVSSCVSNESSPFRDSKKAPLNASSIIMNTKRNCRKSWVTILHKIRAKAPVCLKHLFYSLYKKHLINIKNNEYLLKSVLYSDRSWKVYTTMITTTLHIDIQYEQLAKIRFLYSFKSLQVHFYIMD